MYLLYSEKTEIFCNFNFCDIGMRIFFKYYYCAPSIFPDVYLKKDSPGFIGIADKRQILDCNNAITMVSKVLETGTFIKMFWSDHKSQKFYKFPSEKEGKKDQVRNVIL